VKTSYNTMTVANLFTSSLTLCHTVNSDGLMSVRLNWSIRWVERKHTERQSSLARTACLFQPSPQTHRDINTQTHRHTDTQWHRPFELYCTVHSKQISEFKSLLTWQLAKVCSSYLVLIRLFSVSALLCWSEMLVTLLQHNTIIHIQYTFRFRILI